MSDIVLDNPDVLKFCWNSEFNTGFGVNFAT